MDALLGTSLGTYVGVTVLLMGVAAFLTGQAVALIWRPASHVVGYAVLLAFAARFLIFALFQGDFLAFPGVVIDCAVVLGIALSAHRLTYVAKIVAQYPWLYERSGLWGFRARTPGAG
jgi:hypothetical protein